MATKTKEPKEKLEDGKLQGHILCNGTDVVGKAVHGFITEVAPSTVDEIFEQFKKEHPKHASVRREGFTAQEIED